MVDGIDGLLTTQEAAEYVGLSEKTLKWYMWNGRRGKNVYKTKRTEDKLIPDVRIGSTPFFSTATLDDYFALKRKRTTRQSESPDRDT